MQVSYHHFYKLVQLISQYIAVWAMYQALPIIKKKNIYADSFSSLPFSYYDFLKVTFLCHQLVTVIFSSTITSFLKIDLYSTKIFVQFHCDVKCYFVPFYSIMFALVLICRSRSTCCDLSALMKCLFLQLMIHFSLSGRNCSLSIPLVQTIPAFVQAAAFETL